MMVVKGNFRKFLASSLYFDNVYLRVSFNQSNTISCVKFSRMERKIDATRNERHDVIRGDSSLQIGVAYFCDIANWN